MEKKKHPFLWILTASFLLSAVVLFVLFRFVITPMDRSAVPRYTIGVWEGCVAVFERHQPYPKQVYDMPVTALPHELRQRVLEGVPVHSEEELSLLLEDYTG